MVHAREAQTVRGGPPALLEGGALEALAHGVVIGGPEPGRW